MKTCLVLTSYNLPISRPASWLRWNVERLIACDIGAIIACDAGTMRELAKQEIAHPGVVALRYPEALEMFSLSKTSNWAIRMASLLGSTVIVKTDIDCFWPLESLAALEEVEPGHGLCFPYKRCLGVSPSQLSDARPWLQGKGTMALHVEDWRRVRGYDERMAGYGIEDGDCFTRGLNMGIEVKFPKDLHVYHVEHDGFWNRDNHFNPKRHRENSDVKVKVRWHDCQESETWGIPQKEQVTG